MTVGADNLLKEYGGSRIAVAEALLRNEIDSWRLQYVDELISPMIMEAAKFRVENAGKDFLKTRKSGPKTD